MGIPRIPARVANISASGDQITLHLDWGWVCSKCAQKEEFSADARPDEVTVDATDPNNTLKVCCCFRLDWRATTRIRCWWW